jgi:hypothetical protein
MQDSHADMVQNKEAVKRLKKAERFTTSGKTYSSRQF